MQLRTLLGSLFLLLVACGGGASSPAIVPKSAQPSNTIYVANVRSANAVHLDSAGKAQLVLQGGVAPSGVAVTSTGDIAIPGNQQNILFFHPGQTTPFRLLRDPKICATHGIAFDGRDDAFVYDPICSNIYVYDSAASGTVSPAAALHVDEKNDGDVLAFDVDAAGMVYVLTGKTLPAAIHTYAYDAVSKTFSPRLVIDGAAKFPDPSGVTVLTNGHILVSNAEREIVELDAAGALVKRQPVQGLCTTTWLRSVTRSGEGFAFASNLCGDNGAPSITGYDVTATPAPGPTGPTFTIAGPSAQLGITRESGIAIDQSGGPADGTLYVSNPLADSVNGYCFAACFGNSYPSTQLSLGYPVMNGVQALYFANGLMYTTDSATPAISIFAAPSNGDSGTEYPAPIARILAPPGDMCGLSYAVVDSQHNVLASQSCAATSNFIAKYTVPPNAHGDMVITPSVFAGTPGSCSGSIMCNPQQMVLDAHGNLYVTNYGSTTNVGSILKFSPSGALTATMTSADIHNPSGIALDPQGNLAVFSNTGSKPEIAFYTAPPDQTTPGTPINTTPIRVISGPNTQLGGTPFPQLVIGKDGTIYADVFSEILVFAPGAAGDAAPSAQYTDPALTGGTGLAIAP